MPSRTISIEGESWRVYPSGFLSANVQDEFGLIFVRGTGAERTVRVTRYSPRGSRSRETSLRELSDAALTRLFAESQPSFTSPEAGYLP